MCGWMSVLQIVSAIAIDGNKGWWPVAYAVVEKEATEQFPLFFHLLVVDLENCGDKWTIMSDRTRTIWRSKWFVCIYNPLMALMTCRDLMQHYLQCFQTVNTDVACNTSIATSRKCIKAKRTGQSREIQLYDKTMDEFKKFDREGVVSDIFPSSSLVQRWGVIASQTCYVTIWVRHSIVKY